MNLDNRLLALSRAVRGYLALTVGLGLLAGVVTVVQALFLSRIVGQVFLDGQSLGGVQTLLFVLLGVIILRAILVWGRDVASYHAAGRIKSRLRERLFEHLLALGPARLRAERTGELAGTVTEGVEALDAYFGQYLPNLALSALVPLSVLAFVFPLDAVSGIVLLVTAPLLPLFMILIGKLADYLTKRQWESLSRMSAHFLDVLQGITTLKLFGRSKAQIEIIGRISAQFGETTLRVLRVAFLSALVLEMLGTISTAIVAVEVGLRLLYGTISFEQAFFVLILAPEFYLPLRTLGASFHAGMSGVAAAERIFSILESEPQAVQGKLPDSRSDRAPSPSWSSIRFEDVHYSYEDGARPALRGVSFEIHSGQAVALVGPSGAGKSTVAQLLLRFIEPEGGHILVGGSPLGGWTPEAWRGQVAWVPQTPYLFNATIAENIRLGMPDATDEAVVKAATLARADAFIRDLPLGYDTPIGEMGARLSGGQAQRVALARAFLKDAPLLILDEPTANLDAREEALVQQGIEQLMAGRTVLIIAHRLSTVRRAGQIVVLDAGRVSEAGTHESLVAGSGLYGRLVVAYGGLA